MVVKRKYTYFWKLCNDDPASKEAYLKTFENIEEENRQRIIEYNYQNRLYGLDMGCGIPGEDYRKLCEAFEKLDEEHPYDNGIDISQVTDIRLFNLDDEPDVIHMIFMCRFDGWNHIAKTTIISKTIVDKMPNYDLSDGIIEL